MTAPLSESQRTILVALLDLDCPTPNEIGMAVGARHVVGGRGQGGRGKGHRSFGPAQAIIPALLGLRKRELIQGVMRKDGQSGIAYVLTEAGEREAKS